MSSNSHPNPFKGLRPFKQEEQEELFGRERDLLLMKDRILSSRTTLLFAGSGVGKTSFLNAKVIPALAERYCVIWHNRWTGADERSDVFFDDHTRFRMWPPRAFARWFSEWLIEPAWLRQKHSERNFLTWEQDGQEGATSDKTDPVHKKVTEAVQNVISHSLRPGNKRRLSRVLSIFKKKPESTGVQKPCILILDQFEEIFQYHAYETYFQDFISDVCKIINDDNYQVRVVFSMREEFLGELSVFDNRIPDLFNNYYRLRYPEKDEAKYIITETCKLVDIEPAVNNLDKLVDDLSTIEKSSEGGRVDGETANTVRFVRRNFVPPPYLQIVCDTLWREQFDNAVQPATATSNGDEPEQQPPVRFLENYKAGDENAVNGEESGAQKAVREFCKAKLSAPFLKKWEQNLAARAFGFLVTKQGAKMAYELRSLASHMDERVWPLRHTLHKLSLPEARILRESRGPEGSYWFELYHDMYATVVDRWKREYTKEQRKHQRRRFVVYACLLTLLILMPFAVFYYYVKPREYRQTINQFRDKLETTDIKNAPGYTPAIAAYIKLMETFGYFHESQLLWAKVWQKRAHLFQAKQQREQALLSLLQAASLVRGSPSEKRYIAEANNLLTGTETAIKQTYCYNCRFARFSPDGRFVLTLTKDNNVDVWFSEGVKVSTVCFDCSGAQFSADSNLVASVRNVTEEKSRADANRERSGGGSEKTERGVPASGSTSSTPEATPTPGTISSTAKTLMGWEVKITGSEPVSFLIKKPPAATKKSPEEPEGLFNLRAVAKTPAGYLVAGFLAGRLTIWRQDGSIFTDSVPIDRHIEEFPGRPLPSFSPNGKFFAVYGPGYRAALWEVSATGLSRVTKIEKLSPSRIPLFSTDGKYLLAQTEKGELKLWELSGQTEVLKVATSGLISRFGFATGSSKFFVAEESGKITVWDGETKQQTSSFPVPGRVRVAYLAKDGRSLILASSAPFVGREYQKWSSESKQKIGELTLSSLRDSPFTSSDGDSLLVTTDSIVRLWDVPPPQDASNWLRKISNEALSVGSLSEDGNILLASDSKVRRLDIAQQKETFQPMTAHNYAYLSPDGNRIANVPSAMNVDLFDYSKPQQPPAPLSFKAPLRRVAFSSDSRFFAVATDDQKVQVFDASNGTIISSFVTEVSVKSLSFTRDSQYLLVSREGSFLEPEDPFENTPLSKRWIEVWSIQNGQNTLSQLDQKEKVQAAALRNDRVAVFQNQKILVLNVKNGESISEFPYAQDLALLELSPDEKSVITCDRTGVVQLWDANSGKAGPTVTLGSPALRIVFDEDGASFLAVTGTWIHRIEIGKDYATLVNGHLPLNPSATLSYDQGIFTGEIYTDSVRLVTLKPAQEGETPARFLRWLRRGVSGLEIVEASFDGTFSKSVLNDSADKLLKAWEAKLGFFVSEFGSLENDRDLASSLPELRNSVK